MAPRCRSSRRRAKAGLSKLSAPRVSAIACSVPRNNTGGVRRGCAGRRAAGSHGDGAKGETEAELGVRGVFCSAGAWWWDGVRGARMPAAPRGQQHPGDTPTPSPGTLLLQHGLIPKTAQGLSQMSPAAGRVGDSEGTRSSGVLLGRGGAQHRSLPAISKGPGGGALAQILLKMAKGGVLTCGSAPISASGESPPCRELTDTLQHPVPPPPPPAPPGVPTYHFGQQGEDGIAQGIPQAGDIDHGPQAQEGVLGREQTRGGDTRRGGG